MHELLNKRTRVASTATPDGTNGVNVFTTTGDKFAFAPSNPITILRWGLVLTVAKDASAMVLKLDTRVTVGSDTGRVTSDTMTDSATARAIGVMLERNPILGANPNTRAADNASDPELINIPQGGPVKIYPGQEAVVQVSTAASSTGSGRIFIEYIEHVDAAQYTSLTSTTPAYTVVKL